MVAKILISNSSINLKSEIEKTLQEFGVSLSHPDVLYFDSDSKLGIEQARSIKEHFSIKPLSSKGKVAILEDASALTTDAQQALLKTLEELPENALFLLGSNSDAHFLPTVLSRCQILRIEDIDKKDEDLTEIEQVLSGTLQEKFEYVEKCKDKEALLNLLIKLYRNKMLQNPSENAEIIKEIMEMEKYAKQNVNIRGILEYIMLTISK